ncbi:type III glutamate--ammonia ligase [Gluconacetobacter azotocaptans]|uniref:type III glutamate--ammonia ligase n=1 Tax=Gluconacetobacter azotocaptans TaxID=142834 RepID=UPI0019583814|nr:type III glutamate--ammonia ligase [Gluconacetobacter azotocaptans]MBM9400770.1 type III glutamate--ammonia ligase [Gluconacetobacter azotocaptans]
MGDLAEIAREKNIRYFMISFVDLAGTQRAKLVPASAITGVQKNGAGFAGFAASFIMSPADPDLLAIPDPNSLIQLPWKPEVGWLASDLVMHGKPVSQGPRNALKRLIARAMEYGIDVKTGVECEFFLITPDGQAVSDPFDASNKPCYDASALMRRYDIIAELSDAMQTLGWEPYQSDHEDANGQFEMNWKYADILLTADRHVFFKFMARSIAERHGLRATFMPKPFMHLTGSGCHAHISLWKDNENVCGDPGDRLELSPTGYHFVGGLIHNADALCAMLNPVVNSYKRINAPRTVSGATWSPNTVTYSDDNRTHMIRVPGGGRFEIRLPDGASNPYLMQAAILAAGLDGVEQKRDPGAPLFVNMYTDGHKVTDAKRLPLNLLDALRALDKSDALRGMLGDGLIDPYLALKTAEWNTHCGYLSEWERTVTLDC